MPWAHGAPYEPPSRLLVHRFTSWFAILALSIGMAAVDVAPNVGPALAAPQPRPWLEAGIPRRYHVGGLNLFQLLSPTALGGPSDYFGDDNYWETVFSIGLAGLALAVIAAARHPDRQLVRGWLMLAGLAIAFACGRSLGLYPLIYSAVPGMAWFRVPARSLFLANLAAAVLAGLGIETLRVRMADAVSWQSVRHSNRGGLGHSGQPPVSHPARPGAPGSFRLAARQARRVGIDPSLETSSGSSRWTAPAVPPASRRTALASARVLQDGGFWFAMVSMAALAVLGMPARWRPRPTTRRRPVRPGRDDRAGLVGIRADPDRSGRAVHGSGRDRVMPCPCDPP